MSRTMKLILLLGLLAAAGGGAYYFLVLNKKEPEFKVDAKGPANPGADQTNTGTGAGPGTGTENCDEEASATGVDAGAGTGAAPVTDPTADPNAAPATDPTADPNAAPVTDPGTSDVVSMGSGNAGELIAGGHGQHALSGDSPLTAAAADPNAAPVTDPNAAPVTDPNAAPESSAAAPVNPCPEPTTGTGSAGGKAGANPTMASDGTNSGNNAEALATSKAVAQIGTKSKLTFSVQTTLLPVQGGIGIPKKLKRYRASVTAAALSITIADPASQQQWDTGSKSVRTKFTKSFLTFLKKKYPKSTRSVTVLSSEGKVLSVGDAAASGSPSVRIVGK